MGGGGTNNNKALSRKSEKYYQLAKAHGYRSRAAFKLVQLNKKFDFLGSAKTLLDLCAAPGGWMQVALKYMPVQSKIVGVDLAPIKSIPGTVSFVGDITTAETRKELAKIFQKQKVDVVLHDGAPNMGTNWNYDAYQQNELTLKALKLATEFLRKNGTFVTKIFRSRDYNSLQFVLGKLFSKVTATKPNASRNESAEIFCVCQGYLAPDRIDDKMLDPRFIFVDVEKAAPVTLKSFDPQKRPKKNRDGYSGTSDVLLFERRNVTDFLASEDPISFLYQINQLVWDDDARQKYFAKTPQAIQDYMEDIKLITGREAKEVLKWRSQMRGLGLMPKNEEEEEEEEGAPAAVQDKAQATPEVDLDAMVDTLDRKRRRQERKKREVAKKRQLAITRGMLQEGDEWDMDRDDELFDLEAAQNATLPEEEDAPDAPDEEDEGKPKPRWQTGLADELNFAEMVDKYLEVSHKKSKREKVRIRGKLVAVVDPEEDEAEYEEAQRLRRAKQTFGDGKSADWFAQEIFAGVDADVNDAPEEQPLQLVEDAVELEGEEDPALKRPRANSASEEEESEEEVDAVRNDEDDEEEDGLDVLEASKESNAKRLGILKMGRAVLNGTANLKDMVDDSFGKWTVGTAGDNTAALPDWFVEKEREYWKPFEGDQEELFDAKDVSRTKGIADRPLKRVVEAKARRKRKIESHMKRLAPKVTAIANNSEMGQAERIKAISKLYRGVAPKERGRVYVVSSRKEQVSKKRTAKGKKRGAIKMVDSRLKADNKRAKKEAKKSSSRKRGAKKG